MGQQLGSDPMFGPFATVLRAAMLMLAVLTHQCDIYTRLWCVFEIFVAAMMGVRVKLCPHIAPIDIANGWTNEDICVSESKTRVDSASARCGHPKHDPNSDEVAIRQVVNASAGGFDAIDKAVERIRLGYLIDYDLGSVTNDNAYWQTGARDHIKEAIEELIPNVHANADLKLFEDFLSQELSARPGFSRVPKMIDYDNVWQEYYIAKEDEEKIDIFDA